MFKYYLTCMTSRNILVFLSVSFALLSCQREGLIGERVPCSTRPPVQKSVDGINKFSLSLYHFNIQYVADGDKEIEDRIVTQSFEPLLDLYLKHPNWSGSIEMQGYMAEVIAERFPNVLQKMRLLVENGQIELISYHYSHGFFLAYPRRDMEMAWSFNRDVFDKLCLTLSQVYFAQEGQFGEGMADFVAKHGGGTVLYPTTLFKYYSGNIPAEPVYTLRGANVVIVGRGVDYQDGLIQSDWSFFDDGEKFATGDLDPYAGKYFAFSPTALKEREDRLLEYESDGYCICTISDYLRKVRSLGIKPAPLPSALDGVWAPEDTCNLFRWMGGPGFAFSRTERDNDVLTSAYSARNELVAAETLVNFARSQGLDVAGESISLTEAWRYQMFAEITDASGWNPTSNEVNRSLSMSSMAFDIASEIIEGLKARLDYPHARIDTLINQVDRLESVTGETLSSVTGPLEVLVSALDRVTSVTWTQPSSQLCNFSDTTCLWNLSISFSPTTGERGVSVSFPRSEDRIIYSPALLEDQLVDYPLSDFTFSKDVWVPDCKDKEITSLPLSNGLIGLGNGLFLITHNSTVHVAALVDKASQNVVFLDRVAPVLEGFTWKFSIYKGSVVGALAEANRINTWPVLER